MNPPPLQLLRQLGGTLHPVTPAPDSPTPQEIGRLGPLPVWRVQLQRSGMGGLARRLARNGMVGLLIGWLPDDPVLQVAVTLAQPRVIPLPPGRNGSLLIRRSREALAVTPDSTLGLATALADALDLDSAGRATFALLHQLVASGVEQLPSAISLEDRHAWVLIQCTRLLFLRFIESEGWLNQELSFLARQFDRVLQRRLDPSRHLLERLFFGTLNRPQEQRHRSALELGRIPFLNGGLFEPHPVELQRRFRAPLSWWEEVATAFTSRIEVTLDHSTQPGEVSPEMLGRVFEGVMLPDERKVSGAFYTPAPLVRAVVRAGLIATLAQRLSRSEAALDRGLDDPDPVLLQQLLQLRLLDPAVGSGAFLVGALELLHGPGPGQVDRVRKLVTHSLHGIDRHPGAVRITELRLWLETLRPLRGIVPERVPPLPNLDAAVRAGDALLDPFRGQLPARTNLTLARDHQLVEAGHGPDKREALARWRKHERAAALTGLRHRLRDIQRKIQELGTVGESATLFGDSRGLTLGERQQLGALQAEQQTRQQEHDAILRGELAAPFAAAIAFAPILSTGGFDLVIGNPPWVRAERLPAWQRSALAERYRWWRSAGQRGFRHQPDLSVAFLERSLELTAPGGALAMVVPAKLATTDYASILRQGLAGTTKLHRVADLSQDPRAAFQATTYPMALIATREVAPLGHRVRLTLDREDPGVAQAEWRQEAPWQLQLRPMPLVLSTLQRFPRLSESCTPRLGVKTGANRIFLNPPSELHQWSRSALRGRDIRAHRPTTASARLLWTADQNGNPLPDLPTEVMRYLVQHRADLERRRDLNRPPWWQLFRTRAATAPHRVIWSDLARRLWAVAPEDPSLIPLNSCYLITVTSQQRALALAAWLNCTWIGVVARRIADPATGGYARFNARVVAALPLPGGVVDDPALAALAHPGSPTQQQLLDGITGDYLQLTERDRNELTDLASSHC